MKTLAAFAIFSLLLLGGCSSPQDPAHVEQVEGASQFEATYRQGSGTLRIQLADASPRADRDLAIRNAWLLIVSWDESAGQSVAPPEMNEGERVLVYHLDAGFRIGRVDATCPIKSNAGCAPDTLISWDVQGAPPPLGMAWPWWEAASGQSIVAGQHLAWPIQWTDTATGRTATTGAVPGNFLSNFEGTLEFGLSPVPDRIRGSASMGGSRYTFDAQLQSYTAASALSPIEPWPMQDDSLNARQGVADVFAGDDQTIPQRTIRYRDGYDQLLKLSPEAANAMHTGGCLVRYSVTPEASGTAQTSDPTAPTEEQYLNPRQTTFKIGIANVEGRVTEYKVQYHTQTLVSPARFFLEDTAEIPHLAPCGDRIAGGDADDFFEVLRKADTLPVDGKYRLWNYNVDWYGLREAGQVPHGARQYRALFEDPNSDPIASVDFPPQATYDATAGWWQSMLLPIEAVAALDRGDAREPQSFPT